MSTLKVDTVRPVTTDGSLTLQGDASGAGVTGLVIDSTGTATTFNASNINGGQIGGFRNLIINGNFQVNQRGAASRTTTSSAYNYDRWYYDGTDLYQVIEGQNVRAVLHAISWSGSGLTAAWVSSANTTASIPTGFTAITSGSTFTPTASTNLWIKFSGTLANLAEVQVEAGSTATAFEHRPYGVELALCQRYYQKFYDSSRGGINLTSATAGRVHFTIHYFVVMRATPDVVYTDVPGNLNKFTTFSGDNQTMAAGGFFAFPDFLTTELITNAGDVSSYVRFQLYLNSEL